MKFRIKLSGQSYVVYLIWAVLALELGLSLFNGHYSLGFIALVTMLLSLAPAVFADRFDIQLPVHFFAGIVLFILARFTWARPLTSMRNTGGGTCCCTRDQQWGSG